MKTISLSLSGVLAASMVLFGVAEAAAHEGPEHDIEELTEEIHKKGESADLLVQRAIEYRVLGKWTEASRDLERATKLQPNSLLAHRELSRVQFSNGKTNEALSTVTRGISLKSEEEIEVGGLHMWRAEILRTRGEYKKALEDCERALSLHKSNPEWYLLRSDLQERLKMPKERLSGLDVGIRETGAGVLEIEKVEALLDDHQFAVALEKIEAELASSRIQSSWLIRRARARLGMEKKHEAATDLKAALEEIGSRLNLTTPDVPLLMDKALAHELLEEVEEAHRYYEQARDAGAEGDVRAKIKALKSKLDAISKEKRGKSEPKDPAEEEDK